MLASLTTIVLTIASVDWTAPTARASENAIENYGLLDRDNCPQRPKGWKQIFGEGRCRKSCSADSDCRKRHKQCICDGECGFSCISPTSRCHALMDMPNGYIRTPRDFVFDSVAEYGCDSDYTLIGPASRRCQGNREWSGIQPTCRLKAKCGPPPQIPYATHGSREGQLQYELDVMLDYSCIPGYYRYNAKGLPKAKCMLYNGTARWFGPDLKCSARSCGNPGELLNGIREGDLFEYPHIVKYRCVFGFELFGSAMRKCQANGGWSGERPICKPIQCIKPADPANGHVLGTSLAYQSKVRYNCRDGYRLVGQVQRICQADGSWSGTEPFCEEIRCPSVGPLWNGYIEGDKTNFNDIVVFRCLEAMTQVGPSFARCQDDGTWSHPLPKCLAPCPVPKIERGSIRRWNESQLVYHGERIQVECLDNHELEYPEYPLCHNGSWSHVPRCVPVRCKTWPPKVPNSQVIFAKTNHNSMARYECNAGYRLIGDAIIHCLFGQWTGTKPICDPMMCPNPKHVSTIRHLENGRIMLEGKTGLGTYEYTDYIRSVTQGRHIVYECFKGFTLIGRPLIVEYCDHPTYKMGNFSHGTIKLNSFHGAFTYSLYVSKIGEKREIVFECDKGFYLQGPPRATCVNGMWRPSVAPTCERKTHPLVQGRIVWNRVARKKRSARRRRKRNAPLTCPALYDNRRQRLAVIRLNRLDDGTFPDGSHLMVLCRPGFELPQGSDGAILCSNGSWVPDVPMCQPKHCQLPNRPHSFFLHQDEILQAGANIRHKQGARMLCLRGYQVHGNDVVECNLGKWLKTAGDCVPMSCSLPFLRYGYYRLSPLPVNITHGTEIRFDCGNGNMIAKPADGRVLCALGNLRPHSPECNPEKSPYQTEPTPADEVGCPRPVEIDKAWVYRQRRLGHRLVATLIDPYQDIYPNDTVVHYKCEQKNRKAALMSSQASAVRCIDGEWIAQLVQCAPPLVPPGGVDSNSTLIEKLQAKDPREACGEPDFEEQVEILDQHPGALDTMRQNGFPHGTVLNVACLFQPHRNRQKWSIKCKRGSWKRMDKIHCPNFIAVESNTVDMTDDMCTYSPEQHPNVFAYSPERQESIQFDDQFPNGSWLWFRCQEIGLFRFKGSRKVRCRKGDWQGRLPSCKQLDPNNSWGQAPPVLYRVQQGHLGITPQGVVIARKSSTVYFECLFPKHAGQPRWETNSSYRAYPQTWSQVAIVQGWKVGRKPPTFDSWRLTVAMAQPEDSAIYHCVVPSGHIHSIRLKIKDIECPPLTSNESLLIINLASPEPYFGVSAHLSCSGGHKLHGVNRMTCMENGEWSHALPSCSPRTCPSFTLPHPALSANVSSSEFRGVARFACSPGYMLAGPTQIHCLALGRWSDPAPTCAVVTCKPPTVSAGTEILNSKLNYTYGDVVIFRCRPGYMLTGRDFAVCSVDGQWDHDPPDCVRFCRFPGRPADGDTTSIPKEYYLIGDKIVYYCPKRHFELVGENVLECKAEGWSRPVPNCRRR